MRRLALSLVVLGLIALGWAAPVLASTISYSLDFTDSSWAPADGQASYSRTLGTGGDALTVTLTARSWGHNHGGQQVNYNAQVSQSSLGLGVRDLYGPGNAALIDDNTYRFGNRVQESIEATFSTPVDIDNFWVSDFFQETGLFGNITAYEAGMIIAYDSEGNEIYNLLFNAGQVSPGDSGYLGPGLRLYDSGTLGINLSNVTTIAFLAASDDMNPGWPTWLGGIGDESNYALGGMEVTARTVDKTPEPATLLLLSSAILGAAGLGLRRRA